MTNQDTIGRYVREVERWTPGPARRQRDLATELEGHLRDAEAEGHLAETLLEFGSARDAARSLVSGRTPQIAALWRRVAGCVIDWVSLVAIGASGILASAPFGGTGQAVSVDINQTIFLPGLSCTPGPCSAAGALAFHTMIVAAIFWYVVVLTLLEWRYGRSLGKLIAGTRVIAEDGTSLAIGQAVVRRLPFFFLGPLGTIDWAFALFGSERQRGFDRIARTLVVRDARDEGEAR
jgi:uncharacterized RDD family membrane protein YckC